MNVSVVSGRTITVNVRGVPHPQGSMKAHPMANGKTALRYPPGVYAWRAQVQQACVDGMAGSFKQFTGPVELRLGFDLTRPQSHYLPVNSRRTEPELNPNAPSHPAVMPDLDKLVRCVCDAITDAGLWRDDGQVVTLMAGKRYTPGVPGCLITVSEVR